MQYSASTARCSAVDGGRFRGQLSYTRDGRGRIFFFFGGSAFEEPYTSHEKNKQNYDKIKLNPMNNPMTYNC